jgi:hypothetical protein
VRSTLTGGIETVEELAAADGISTGLSLLTADRQQLAKHARNSACRVSISGTIEFVQTKWLTITYCRPLTIARIGIWWKRNDNDKKPVIIAVELEPDCRKQFARSDT